MRYIDSISAAELAGKKVLLRVDFNVPVEQGKITEDFRIRAHRPTLDYLLDLGAQVVMVSHIESAPSFLEVAEDIGDSLGRTLTLVPLDHLSECEGLLAAGLPLLLDNIRQDPREEANDPGFARELAEGFDLYVNDAFSVSHRAHASVDAITELVPSYGGFLMKREIEELTKILEAPAEGKVIVLGGAKIGTKLPVIRNFLDKAEKILVGGALANNYFLSRGIAVGSSAVEPDVEVVENPKILIPHDMVISSDLKTPEPYPVRDIDREHRILDIGPQTALEWEKLISQASMVVWNGPMGLSEIEAFASGTERIARAAVRAAVSSIGGGDTIAAVRKLGLLDAFSFVSTGGGAMLAFLAGGTLPGVAALERNE